MRRTMFYVMDPDVNYLEISEIELKKPECRKCGWRSGDRPGGITVVMTRRSEAMPIIQAFDRPAFSEYAIRVFQDAGITGWHPLPQTVKIRRRGLRRNVRIPIYHEILVAGRAGHISQYPGVRVYEQCSQCGHKTYVDRNEGIYVDTKLWDGCDIFEIENLPPTLVTQKVVDLVTAKRMRGIEFIPAQEWRDIFLSSLTAADQDSAGDRRSY